MFSFPRRLKNIVSGVTLGEQFWSQEKLSKVILSFVLLCVSVISFAEKLDPYKGPRPIAVLMQTNPWLMVIGSDTPRLVIYSEGEVVYLQMNQGQGPQYVCKQLTEDELETIRKKLISFGDYSSVKRHYNLAPNVTDMPETMIYLNPNGKEMVTTVYGLQTQETHSASNTVFSGGPSPDKLPEVLRSLYSYLVALKFSDARQWQPRYVEVMIWDYSYAPDRSIHWPKERPGLESPQTFKRGDSYSIFMPATEAPNLSNFLKKRKEKGAVEIGGRKWAVAFRYTFPSEPVWAAAFRGSN